MRSGPSVDDLATSSPFNSLRGAGLTISVDISGMMYASAFSASKAFALALRGSPLAAWSEPLALRTDVCSTANDDGRLRKYVPAAFVGATPAMLG